jgi:general nucleoside transport system ATP-binding protein
VTARPARRDALALRGIVKRFGPVEALSDVDLAIAPGEIHALLGENGAGKSTLMHIAYGMLRPDAGEILIDGVPHHIDSPRRARDLGIGMVHQHFTSVAALSVAENVALAAGWDVSPRALPARVEALAREVGLPLDPLALADDLSVPLKQRLEIVKALAADARVLLLDEPTAVLAPAEALELLRMVRAYVERGNSAVLITHKLDEALAAADRVTVLRRGSVIRSGPAAGESREALARAMIGDAAAMPDQTSRLAVRREQLDEPVVVLKSVTVMRAGSAVPGVSQVSLSVAAGEIVGVAGVEGNGQRELLRAVAGLARPVAGTLTIAQPVAFIPEDRTTEGLIGEMSLTENLVLGMSDTPAWSGRDGSLGGSRWGGIRWDLARRRMEQLIGSFGIRSAGPDAEARTLSGGNQQKVIIARALERTPRVIVAEHPTRGLDILATREVHDRLRAAAAAGAAVLFSSGDLDEVVQLATRVVVAVGGHLFDMPAGAGRPEIGAAMLGRPR